MQTIDLQFAGLNSPLRIVSPEDVMPLLEPVFAGWTWSIVPAERAPFATMGPSGDGRTWRLSAPLAETPEALHVPVNAICDLIVEMSWERLRSRPDLLCLHAAAVVFGDRLVIFPNQRRAGKSLLSATMARRGHAVFSDDFIPLAVDPETRIVSGVANGIVPRLRLPLPETLSPAHAAWIDGHIAVRNKQYGYLTGVEVPHSGSELPVGAIVMLDRDMQREAQATLTPVMVDEALSAIVTQNFGRHVHAGAILAITHAMATTVPVLRLTYRDVDEAAALLQSAPLLSGLPEAQVAASAQHPPTRLAPLERLRDRTREVAVMDHAFTRVPGYTEAEAEGVIYLASVVGLAIHRLNPVSAIIWRLLEEPMDGESIASLLADVFPDVASDQLRADVKAALTFMLRDGMISQG